MSGINKQQLLEHVIYPVINALGFDEGNEKGSAALILYTGQQESQCGAYIKQVGGGPALGLMQIEPATHSDMHNNWLSYRHHVYPKIFNVSGIDSDVELSTLEEMLIYNLRYSVAIARCIYRRSPLAIPEFGDDEAMWDIYKISYNSFMGAATREEFMHAISVCRDDLI